MSWTAVMSRHGKNTCANTRLAIDGDRCPRTGAEGVTDNRAKYRAEMAALDEAAFLRLGNEDLGVVVDLSRG
jgi:hypothetical protein